MTETTVFPARVLVVEDDRKLALLCRALCQGGLDADAAFEGDLALERLRTVMLTARDSVDDLVAGLRAGATDYRLKPFSLDELVARLNDLFRDPELSGALPHRTPRHMRPGLLA